MTIKKPVEQAISCSQATQPSQPSDAQSVAPQPTSQQKASSQKPLSAKKKDGVDYSFARAANEDDDGYDPWSDRPAKHEPLFQADPWS